MDTLRTEVQSLPELLLTRAGEIGDERFVRDAHREWSYAEFAGRVAECAAGLRELGVKQGDVVEKMSDLLATRQAELDEAASAPVPQQEPVQERSRRLISQIRSFFQL